MSGNVKVSRVLYAGSFNPITIGHMDIIRRAAAMFEEVVVLVSNNPDKKYDWTIEQRAEMVRAAIREARLTNVIVVNYFNPPMTVNAALYHDCQALIRGLRSVTDFEYELSMAQINKLMVPDMETIFLTCDNSLSNVSSSAVREMLKHNEKSWRWLVPGAVAEYIDKLKER